MELTIGLSGISGMLHLEVHTAEVILCLSATGRTVSYLEKGLQNILPN
jgi:hypothetical protein